MKSLNEVKEDRDIATKEYVDSTVLPKIEVQDGENVLIWRSEKAQ